MKIILFIYSLYTWFILITTFFIHFLVTRFFDCRTMLARDRGYALAQRLLKVALKLTFISVECVGFEKFPKNKSFILAPNHQSQMDVVVLAAFSPINLSFFSKQELLKVPVLRTVMHVMDVFTIDRKNARAAVTQMKGVREKIIEGRSVVVFPEGTRSRDQKIHEFKRGAFVLAEETNSLVLPVYIQGAGSVMPPGKFLMKPGKIKITCLDPILMESSLSSPKERSNDLKERAYTALHSFETLLCDPNATSFNSFSQK